MKVRPRIHDTSTFDSIFQFPSTTTPVNCELTIEIGIYLDRIGTGRFNLDGTSFRTRPWTNREWSDFVFRYRHISESYWNNRFWLYTPAGYDELDLPFFNPQYRPNVKCKLRLNIIRNQATEPYHVRIRAVHLADDEGRFFRSNARTYCQHDVVPEDNQDHWQITVVHEVGHLLNIDHPGVRRRDPVCLADGNADQCYEGDELMGLGLAFPDDYAKPWRDRIAMHTNTNPEDWTVLRQETGPRFVHRLDPRRRAAG